MNQPIFSAGDVHSLFSSFQLDDAEKVYLNGQAKRIAYLRNLVQQFCEAVVGQAQVLDIGPHFLSRCLVETVQPKPLVSTLGWEYAKLMPRELVHSHANIDLNNVLSLELPFQPQSFDIILFCEVVEHLFIPPNPVLEFLGRMLKPKGVIICGTPNATSISKRLKMMMGENPFQPLFTDFKHYRGHIREYTMDELRRYGEVAGLRSVFEEYNDYWDQYLFPGSKEISKMESEIPMFRGGLTIAFQASEG